MKASTSESSLNGIALGLEGACLTRPGGGFVGLVFRFVSFHISAVGLRLYGWKVVKCQKHGFGERAQLTLQTPDG